MAHASYEYEGASVIVPGSAALRLPSEALDVRMAHRGLAVHLVGRLTPPVLSFLLPTLSALHASGHSQELIYIERPLQPLPQAQLPKDLRLHPIADHASPLGRVAGLHAGLGRLAQDARVDLLHLHGLLPSLAALHWLYRQPRGDVHVCFSPHSSRALARQTLLRTGLAWLVQLGLGRHDARTIVSLTPELQTLELLGGLPASVIESPVPQVFFDTPRHEARRPLLISCGMEGQRTAVDGFARIAVLLNGTELKLCFNWVGAAEPDAANALKAAGVGQFDILSDESRAQRLGSAWIYVAPTQEHGFPVRLAEAMAAGLPCVALDTAEHRSLLEEGVTGYLCSDLRSLLQRIAELVDSRTLRQRMGHAARQAALGRFAEGIFRARLLSTVGLQQRPIASDSARTGGTA